MTRDWREVVKNLPLRYEFFLGWDMKVMHTLRCPVCLNELTQENCFDGSAHRPDCAWLEAQSSTASPVAAPDGGADPDR